MSTEAGVPSVQVGRTSTSGTRPALSSPQAVLLSFFWPGLDQLRRRRRALGLALAVPQAVLITGAGIAWVSGPATVMRWLLEPAFLIGILGLDLVILATRLVAMGEAFVRVPHPPSRAARTASAALLAVLLAVSVGIHGATGQVLWAGYDTLTTVFSPSGPRGGAFGGAPSDSAAPSDSVAQASPSGTSNPSSTPAPTPVPTPAPSPRPEWSMNGRLDLLLIGADSGPGRWKLRADTMILLSVDVETGRAALFGIPRNLRLAPVPPPLDAAFPSGFTDLLNALWVYVDTHPGSYPGDPAMAPFAAVQDTIGLLTGVEVDGMAVVELQGFVRAVDALGGLDINVPAPVYDERYPAPDGTGNVELYIAAGPQHLDGWHALAYARTRHQDGDYWRMERQQTVLIALQRQLRCNLLTRLPDLLGIARDTVWVSLPLDDLPGIVELGTRVDADRIERVTFTPPTYPVDLDAAAIEAIRTTVREVFEAPAPPPIDSVSSPRVEDGC